MKTSRGLGRGLASLIPDEPENESGEKLRYVPIDEIRANPEQPRQHFAKDELANLAESISRHGILTPLLVRKEDGQYVLIAGERRLRAAGLAGLSEVPVIVREADARVEQLELALIENLQRQDLDPIETARGYERLIEDFGLSQDDVARRVGKDRTTVSNAVRLLRLPEFALNVLREGQISAGHARAILPLENPDDLRQVLGKVLAQQLSVRATEQLVQKVLKTPKSVRQEREKRDRAYEYATKLLSEALHTAVEIKPKPKGGGNIVVTYGDAEDLERLIELLRR